MAGEAMTALVVVGMVDWASTIPPLFNSLPLYLTRLMVQVKPTIPTVSRNRGSFQRVRRAGNANPDVPLDSDLGA